MSQIGRLRSAEISNGNLINADDIAAELDQLVSQANSQDTSITSLLSGSLTISGNKTFSGSSTFSGAVTLSSTVSITGTFKVALPSDPGAPAEGMVWTNTTSHLLKFHDGTTTKILATTDNILTRGFIAGLGLVTGTDTANDIDISVGSCRDSSDAVNMVLAATLTKRSDAAWAVGSGNGGMDTGTKPNNGTLHIWLIKRSDTGVVDALFSVSATSPTMPASYDYKRLIGSRCTDSSGNILNMHQYGDLNYYDTPPALDVSVTNQSTTAITRTLSTPGGRRLEAILNVFISNTNPAPALWIQNLDLADLAPSVSLSPLASVAGETGQGGTRSGSAQVRVMTNTSSQIATRADSAGTTLKIAALGWVDRRGKDD